MKHKFLKVMGVLGGCIILTANVNAAASAENIWEYTKSKENGYIVYEFGDMNLKLPESWEGKIQIKEDGDALGFYHKESLEHGTLDGEVGCGALFWLNRSDNYEFTEYEFTYYLVGSGENGVYYITEPGDLHGYQKDEGILNEWIEMSKDVEKIRQETDCENSGAPVLTTASLNLRSKKSMNGKILDIIPSKTAVWVTGNLEADWVQVNYNGKTGYVKADYLKLPEDISSYLSENADDYRYENAVMEEDIRQTENSIVMYTIDGDKVTIFKSSDGNWYDENGTYCGTDEEIQDGLENGGILVNENGTAYFWALQDSAIPGDDIPFQGAFQGDGGVILYDSDGNGIHVEQAADGYWYDENGVCFGYWKDVVEAGITGEPITNENGETYYWMAP